MKVFNLISHKYLESKASGRMTKECKNVVKDVEYGKLPSYKTLLRTLHKDNV